MSLLRKRKQLNECSFVLFSEAKKSDDDQVAQARRDMEELTSRVGQLTRELSEKDAQLVRTRQELEEQQVLF